MNPEAAKRLRLLASAASVLLLIAVLTVGWIYMRIRASLPLLDGRVPASGVGANVTIERDNLGVPTIRGENRIDVARALGWLHGQERFFQMDLLRRTAAGELAEIFGKRAVSRDRAHRIHGFRRVAEATVNRLPSRQRAVLEAYVAGVNAGLSALGEKPFEYIVLREEPQPWKPEDSILVIHAMALDLQARLGNYERSLMTLRDELGLDAVEFFAPVMTPHDAALDGTTAPLPPMPGPKTINLRANKVGTALRSGPGLAAMSNPFSPSNPKFSPASENNPHPDPLAIHDPFPFPRRDPEAVPGSNAFALAGMHTASGAAMLANDMHLDHGIPNTWFRAVLEWSEEIPRSRTQNSTLSPLTQSPSPETHPLTRATHRVAGVTLPGTPAIAAGSNGRVAWGFTNACIDVSDLVVIDVNSIARSLYPAPDHDRLLTVEKRKETIRVKGDDPVIVEYPATIWGPMIRMDETSRPLVLHWVAHDPDATNLTFMEMETATTVAEGIAVAHRAGIPAQNILLADSAGDVAWTIAGRVPKRVGFNGRLPVSWAFGDRRWDGYLAPEEIPVVRGAESMKEGRLWSANQRHVGGDALVKLGDGAYRRPHRAAQIRDGLAKLERATPPDMLAVQLDDRALFLERWHTLLMETLTPAVIDGHKGRTAMRAFAETWEGRASVDAVSYRLVREFRIAVYGRVFPAIFEACAEAYPGFDWGDFQLEPALWTMLEEKPMHLLSADFASWEELLVAACDGVIHEIDEEGVSMPKANWGWRNRAGIRHPFSNSFPWLSSWLNMPAEPLAGGDDMPRVQSPSHGASQRLVVSPGREDEGIFHMPAGQSGHPMSEFYRAGHDAWVRGEPTPFLPGPTQHTLALEP